MSGSVATKWRPRPRGLGRQAEGEAHHLRDEEDRQRLLAALRHRLLAQVEVAVAERAGDDDGLGAVAPRVLDDGAAEPHDGAGAADAEGAAAALDLHVPLDVVGAAGVDDVVHLHRLLGVVVAAELGRADEQAAVVRRELDAVERVGLGQRRRHLLLDERAVLVQQLHGVEHLDACWRTGGRGSPACARRGRPLPRRRGAPTRGGCSRRRRAPARGRSPAPRRGPGCAPAAPRRAGGRWCGRCSRRSSSSPGSRRRGCPAPRPRRAGSRRTRGTCRAASSRGSRRGRERPSPARRPRRPRPSTSSATVLMASPRTARRCA